MDVVTETPAAEAPAAPIESGGEVETTLAEHEAQFGKNANRAEASEEASEESGATAASSPEKDPSTGRFRQRAKSQQASAKDVDQIGELTRRLRTAEAELGLQIEKQPGESDRVFSLRRQAEIAEALREARRTPKPEPPVPQAHARAETPQAPTNLQAFAEREPQPEDFANDPNPLAAYTKAVAGWEWRRQIHDAQQQIMANRAQQNQAEALKRAEEHGKIVDAKIAAFAKTVPDYVQKVKAIEDIKVPDLLLETIATDDNPGEIVYRLACNPDELIDLIGFTAALDYSADSVAIVRRRLSRHARATDVVRGASSPAPTPVLVAPRPPTPLGTGPLKTGDEPPGDDDMSLERHEQFFGRKRRR